MDMPTPSAFERLIAAVAPYFVARDHELYLMSLALVAKVHMFTLSDPGAGKTALIRQFLLRIDGARYFRTMFDPGADDSLVYGPTSIPKLAKGERGRESAGYVADADVWDCDEIWNGSPLLVQALHELVLDRRWKDGNVYREAPLWSMLSASNSTPHGRPELAAIWDRCGLRRITPQITDPADMLAMYRLPTPPEHPDPVLTMDEVRAAHAEAMRLPITAEADEAQVQIMVAGRPLGVTMSGRRQMEARRIAQAAAWLDGASEVRPCHFDFLCDYMWEQPGQYQPLASMILTATAPELAELHAAESTIAALRIEATDLATLYKTDPTAARRASRAVYAKVERAATEVADLEPKITRPRDRKKIARLGEHVQQVGEIVLADVQQMRRQSIPDLMQAAREGTLAAA